MPTCHVLGVKEEPLTVCCAETRGKAERILTSDGAQMYVLVNRAYAASAILAHLFIHASGIFTRLRTAGST